MPTFLANMRMPGVRLRTRMAEVDLPDELIDLIGKQVLASVVGFHTEFTILLHLSSGFSPNISWEVRL
jgi:hypothetical protein